MELLRADGSLRPNSFLRLRKLVENGKPILSVQDFGDSQKMLKNYAFLGESARGFLRRGMMPTEDGWGGWRYQATLAGVARESSHNKEAQLVKSRGRGRDPSLGR
jgi:hypothetical protein